LTGLIFFRIGPVPCSYEEGNKLSGSIKCWNFVTSWAFSRIVLLHGITVIYTCYTSFLNLEEELRLRKFENKMLTKIQVCELMRDEIAANYILDGFHNCYSLHNVSHKLRHFNEI
jgi:hypothetical protein